MKQKMALVYCLLACLILSGAAEAKQTNSPVYKDPGQPIEERIKDLISRMTVEEKVWQLSQYPVGINDNDNNIIDVVKNIPAELGAILYLNTTPAVRNRIQRRAMEESRLGIPMIFGYDVIHGFRTIYPSSLAQAWSWNPTLVSQACAIAAQDLCLFSNALAAQSQTDNFFTQFVSQDASTRDQLFVGRHNFATALFTEYPYALESGDVFEIIFSH